MNFGYFNYQIPSNEPVYKYAPGSVERTALKKIIAELKSQQEDIPMYIGGEEIRTGNKLPIRPTHKIAHTLGYFHEGDETHVHKSIDAALAAREHWTNMSWENRAGILGR